MSAGASPSEQLLEAARRNNTDLLHELLSKYQETPQEAIELINTAKDSSGNGALHLAARYGNYEVMDQLLDIEGVDVNLKATMNGNTPLHYASSYSFEDPEYALFLVNELINCGADPSIKNDENLRPIDLIGDSNENIKEALESAEYATNLDQNIEDIPEDDDIDDEDEDEDDADGDN
jgi:ankyrin repeat protein